MKILVLVLGVFIGFASFAKEKDSARKPSAFSIESSQFQELVNSKLKGTWIEVSTVSNVNSTNIKHTDSSSENLVNVTVRSNYLKVLSYCGEVIQSANDVVICRIK